MDSDFQGGKDGQRASGGRLFLQQSRALLVKNALLSWRNLTATVLQLGASFIFIFLIWAVDRAIKASYSETTYFRNLDDPATKRVSAIPACEGGFFIKTPCYDFLWSGNTSAVITSLVRNLTANNPGRPIDFETKTIGFATAGDVDNWLLANPYRSTGALHFRETVAGLAYGIQTNSTPRQMRGQYEDPTFKFQVPLQAAAERELARYRTKDWNLEWLPSYTEFAHPAIESFSVVASVGPTFLFAAAMFGFVIQMGNLVAEREMKLRQAMATMGLLDSAYWLTWLLWETGLAIISSLLLVLFGMMFQFSFFLDNGFFVVFFAFFLFQLSMISFAFMLSTFISKASSATTVGFLVFILGFFTQLVVQFGVPYDPTFSSGLRAAWSLFPPNLLAIALIYLGDATASSADTGIKWSGINKCSRQEPNCTLTMQQIYFFLLALFPVFFLLALYFDNVLPDVNGVRKPVFFFLYPSFWFGNVKGQEGGGCCKCTGRVPPLPPPEGSDDEDVAVEAEAMQRLTGAEAAAPAISIRGLVKSFAGSTEVAGCCKCKRTMPFHAIKGTWLTVESDSLFCLLGPNGAGKSTTINCLTGIIPATAGDALIYGCSIRTASEMSKIRSIMGVCPQFDILWDALSGREHLHLFASIKGIAPATVKEESEKLLREVNLEEAAKVRAGSYSGGMKRRLSVAIALIGDPKIVFLDEPTTGMDPITRRSVWDIIESAKAGRAIVLTTHSMEEADILGDRIAIMAKGRLRCLGTSIHLKNKFGTGYIVNVAVRSGTVRDLGASEEELARRADNVKHFFRQRLNVEAADETKAYIKFVVPRSKEAVLAGFFEELRARKQELGVTDIQLSLTTLEEVFLNIARTAELESAQAEGRFETLTLPDGVELEVPIGAQYVAVPDTVSATAPRGMVVEVTWQQDEAGALRIGKHSDLMPAPEGVEGEGLGSGPPKRGGAVVGQAVEMTPRGSTPM